MKELKTFRVMVSKPEYLEMLIARSANVDDFGDIEYTTAPTVNRALANIRFRIRNSRYPERRIISYEEIDS